MARVSTQAPWPLTDAPNFSRTQCIHQKYGGYNNAYPIGVLWGFHELIFVEFLTYAWHTGTPCALAQMDTKLQTTVSQPQHYRPSGLDHSLLGGLSHALCDVLPHPWPSPTNPGSTSSSDNPNCARHCQISSGGQSEHCYDVMAQSCLVQYGSHKLHTAIEHLQRD